MSVDNLIQIVLLLVIIWLVAGIRQTMGAPSPGVVVKRAYHNLTGNTPTPANKAQKTDENVSLDQIDPEEAIRAVSEYYK